MEYSVSSYVLDGDRRAKQRFPLKLDLRFKVVYRGKALASGAGRTLDICSGGIRFLPDAPIRPGASVELSVSWPALLDGVCSMQLNLSCRALRSDGKVTVCEIGKYEFRTVGRRATLAAVAGVAEPRSAQLYPSSGSYLPA